MPKAPNEILSRSDVRVLIAILAAVSGLLLRVALVQLIGEELPIYSTFYPALMVAALFAGLWSALLATALSCALISFFILEPRWNFAVSSPKALFGLMLFASIGTFMSIVAARYRQSRLQIATYEREQAARQKEEQLRMIDSARQALRISEDRFRILVEQAPDAFFLHDEEGQFIDVNRQACENLGYSREELLEMSVFDIEKELDPVKVRKAWQSVEPGKALTVGGRHRRKDGTEFPVEARLGMYFVEGRKLFLGLVRDITERSQAEEALRQSLERLQKVMEIQTVGMMFWDLNTGHMIDANASFLKLMGYSRSDVDERKLTWQTLTPPEYIDISRAEVTKFLATGRVGPYEKEYFCKDGTKRWLLFAGSSLGGNQCVEFCVDIADRKQAEQALRESEEKIRSVLESMSEALILFDAEGNVTYHNPASLRLHGFEKDDDGRLQHQDIPAIFETWDIKGRKLTFDEWPARRLLRHERLEHVVLRVRHVQRGLEFCGSYNGCPLYDAAGRLIGGLLTIRDITQELKVTRALEESEARFRDLADNISQFAWIADEKGSIFWYNRRWFEYTGTTMEEMQGWGWKKVHHPDHVERVVNKVSSCFANGETWEDTFPLRGKEGQYRWFLSRAIPICDNGGKVVRWFGTNTDVTEQRRVEQELVELNTQLEERVHHRTVELEAANREASAFSYSVSHDLRAPLRTLDGFSQALLEDHAAELSEVGKHYVERIRVAAQRMASLIDALLSLSRLTRREMQIVSVDLSQLAEDIFEDLRNSDQGRNVEISIEPNLNTHGDSQMLHVALQNLLANAWKFTAKCERAKIEVGKTSLNGNGSVAFFVRDNGAGFDMQNADQLFSPFQRFHPESEFPGTGIGLATVQRVIHRHQGRIWAEAAENRGATFFFELGT